MNSKLWLPTETTRAKSHPILADAHQFYSLKLITDEAATIADVIEQLAPLRREDAIRLICSHSMALLSEQGMSAIAHLAWAKDVFPAEWIPRIQQLMSRDGDDAGLLFHRRSAWLVLQLALMCCKRNAAELPPQEIVSRIWRACFLANDTIEEIENLQPKPEPDNIADWMICTLVPTFGIDVRNVDLGLFGRAQLLWLTATTGPQFQTELKRLGVQNLDATFTQKYGVAIPDFISFVAALHVRFAGNINTGTFSPIKLDSKSDDMLKLFSEGVRENAIPLLAQTPEDLLLKIFQTRQSWIYDIACIRERPLLEIEPGQYCCPDLTLLARACLDRTYFLLQDAYGKGTFRQLFGHLFEGYTNRLLNEFAVADGPARTHWISPKFVGTQDQAADGMLYWKQSAVLMELKAGLLTSRQRHSGIAGELLQGIDSMLDRSGDQKKGTAQLVRNLKRIVSGEQIQCDGILADLSHCERIYPVLVCFDEAIGFHAVTRRLQKSFDELCVRAQLSRERIGPLMLLSIADMELISVAGQSLSVERLFKEYAEHLDNQPKDFTGTFSSFLNYRFGKYFKLQQSIIVKEHLSLLNELMSRAEGHN